MTAFEPRDPAFRAAVERYVAAQGYLVLLGVEVVRVDPGLVEYRVPYRAELGQQDGFFHGGVVGGLAEAVMGAAARTLVAAGWNVVGAEYKINLLSPAVGPAILARGEVVKLGRRLIVCRAEVLAGEAGERQGLCAIAQGTMAAVEAR
jgi:uncharacterized protein (TIGR00369 family)